MRRENGPVPPTLKYQFTLSKRPNLRNQYIPSHSTVRSSHSVGVEAVKEKEKTVQTKRERKERR
jgi:hypothetical protein